MRFSIGSDAPTCQALRSRWMEPGAGRPTAKTLTSPKPVDAYADAMRRRPWSWVGLASAVTLVLLIGCAGDAGSVPGPPSGPTPDPTPDPPQLPTELDALLALVNVARAEARSCGSTPYAATHPLTLESRLTAAAQAHSVDMHTNAFMSHTGSDGSRLQDRVEREGYDWARLAENIASGYQSAASVMSAWLGSTGHCRNIMDPELSEIGLGLAGTSWTQVFGEPR
jgi:uncharacterized protein YkwD